ncbi:MAG: molybdopterin-binding protein, partial [Thermodesulfovibrionales bacterium]|nr:molybdopterin-binding protein [Thermodesulfovibrionales bacterium]
TLHDNTIVDKGQIIAGTRAIPLVIKKSIVEKAVRLLNKSDSPVIEVKRLRQPKAGIVITGNEVYNGKVKDAFAPILTSKIKNIDGQIVNIYYSPDDVSHIEKNLLQLIDEGADLLITTGGMSVDPDDVTRFAIRNIGAKEVIYGSSVLPGAMFLIANFYKNNMKIPILAIPACGMYHKITIFDLLLPRILSGEKITRKEVAELGHGGLCLNCKECRYPICPFGK